MYSDSKEHISCSILFFLTGMVAAGDFSILGDGTACSAGCNRLRLGLQQSANRDLNRGSRTRAGARSVGYHEDETVEEIRSYF